MAVLIPAHRRHTRPKRSGGSARLLRLLAPGSLQFAYGNRHTVGLGPGRRHAHDAIEVVYHSSGTGLTWIEGGGECAFSGGSIEVYPPNLEHCQQMTSAGEDWYIHLQVGKALAPAVPYLFLPAVGDEYVRHEMAALSRTDLPQTAIAQAAVNARAAALLLHVWALDRLPRRRSRVQDLALDARRLLYERLAAIDAIGDIAAELGVSHDHLRHVYKQAFGRSLVRELMVARVEHGRHLLSTTQLPVREIAVQCGFRSQAYFARVFALIEGVAPSDLRRGRRRIVQT